jgi:hypothetical protein
VATAARIAGASRSTSSCSSGRADRPERPARGERPWQGMLVSPAAARRAPRRTGQAVPDPDLSATSTFPHFPKPDPDLSATLTFPHFPKPDPDLSATRAVRQWERATRLRLETACRGRRSSRRRRRCARGSSGRFTCAWRRCTIRDCRCANSRRVTMRVRLRRVLLPIESFRSFISIMISMARRPSASGCQPPPHGPRRRVGRSSVLCMFLPGRQPPHGPTYRRSTAPPSSRRHTGTSHFGSMPRRPRPLITPSPSIPASPQPRPSRRSRRRRPQAAARTLT